MFIMHILVAAVSPGCKGSEELGSEAMGFSVSSRKWIGFLFCLLLGCDVGLLLVCVWREQLLGCVLEQPGSMSILSVCL